MIRKVTKMSTVTPVTKSTGSGVANMGKKSKGLSMYQNKKKSPSRLSSAEAAKEMSSTKSKGGFFKESINRMEDPVYTGAMAGAELPQLMRKAVKTGTKSPSMPQLMRKAVKTGTKVPKPKAKMLPEVTVTAPKPKKRLALKVTSRRK